MGGRGWQEEEEAAAAAAASAAAKAKQRKQREEEEARALSPRARAPATAETHQTRRRSNATSQADAIALLQQQRKAAGMDGDDGDEDEDEQADRVDALPSSAHGLAAMQTGGLISTGSPGQSPTNTTTGGNEEWESIQTRQRVSSIVSSQKALDVAGLNRILDKVRACAWRAGQSVMVGVRG